MSDALTISDDYFFYKLGDLFYDSSTRLGASPRSRTWRTSSVSTRSPGSTCPTSPRDESTASLERQLLHREAPAAFPTTTWYAGDNIEMAFGQGGTVVTPIGLANAYATFANGGTRYKPEVGAALIDPATDKVVKKVEPRVIGHVSPPASDYDAHSPGA